MRNYFLRLLAIAILVTSVQYSLTPKLQASGNYGPLYNCQSYVNAGCHIGLFNLLYHFTCANLINRCHEDLREMRHNEAVVKRWIDTLH